MAMKRNTITTGDFVGCICGKESCNQGKILKYAFLSIFGINQLSFIETILITYKWPQYEPIRTTLALPLFVWDHVRFLYTSSLQEL